MEFDWQEPSFDTNDVSSKEIEESFEDPFALRLLPDGEYSEANNRFFCLGSSVSNRLLFSLFWTDGKKYRVITSRDMSEEEKNFYERQKAQVI